MHLHIVYLSHGGKKYYDQTRFSVLTLLNLLLKQQRQDIHIAVYTDNPTSVPAHELIKVMPLTKAQLRDYRGEFGFVHRIKLMVMRRACDELGTALMYVDCDTRWLTLPPDEIFAALRQGDTCVMHVCEGELDERFFPSYRAAIQRYREIVRRWGVTGTDALAMWNSGVIGTPADAAAFYDDALALSDFLFPRVKPRTWLEQFALSVVASGRYRMVALGDALHHYWNYSCEAPLYLQEVFSKMGADWSVGRQAEYCGQLQWDERRLKQLQQAPENKKWRRRAKWQASIAKRKIDLRVLLARLSGRLTG